MDFRPFYYDFSTNKVISRNSYYKIINNYPIKQFNNFCNFQGQKYFILSYDKLFINWVSSTCTVKCKAVSLHIQPSHGLYCRPRTLYFTIVDCATTFGADTSIFKVLTLEFFPRLNVTKDTRICLLYLTRALQNTGGALSCIER